MTYEKARIIGASTESFTEAADDAIDLARQEYGEIAWAETSLRGIELATVDEPQYQVETVIAYRPE